MQFIWFFNTVSFINCFLILVKLKNLRNWHSYFRYLNYIFFLLLNINLDVHNFRTNFINFRSSSCRLRRGNYNIDRMFNFRDTWWHRLKILLFYLIIKWNFVVRIDKKLLHINLCLRFSLINLIILFSLLTFNWAWFLWLGNIRMF